MRVQAPRLPLLRIILGNATLLSLVYLAIGLVLETLRRVFAGHAPRLGHFVERTWEALDQLPARLLDLAGWLAPLRKAYVDGQLEEYQLRLIFAGTSVALIFALALIVGLVMWLLRALFFRPKNARA